MVVVFSTVLRAIALLAAGGLLVAVMLLAGEPFVASTRLLAVGKPGPVPGRAVAVGVKTTNGHTDVCFADAEPGQMRVIDEVGLQVAGEFAFVSTDAQGLRQATLVGGTALRGPQVRIEADAAGRWARVVKVDYPGKRLWLDGRWPARSRPLAFELGLPDRGHMTTYTALRITPAEGGSVLHLQRGADYYRSEIKAVEADGVVRCALKPLCDTIRGKRKGWVASDEERTRFWRAHHLGGTAFRLTGGPVNREAFGEQGVLRLWEYGVGDVASHRTSVSLRRVGPDRFELIADVGGKLSLRAASAQFSTDGQAWQALKGQSADGWLTVPIPVEKLSDGPLLLRIQP
ncbi:MAG: hypothetical protein ACODAJ_09660 [Planctomycetota bacterium]